MFFVLFLELSSVTEALFLFLRHFMLVIAVPELRNDKPHLPFPVARTTQLNSATSHIERPVTVAVRIKGEVFRALA